jgi:hypothetical protein
MHIPHKPDWFHHHGLKMGIKGKPLCPGLQEEVVIGTNVAELKIRPGVILGEYRLSWKIITDSGSVEGEIALTKGSLANAFALLYPGKILKEEVTHEEVRVQGTFVRRGRFLNIPMPGTGLDGDPNVSIFITKEIQQFVSELLKISS